MATRENKQASSSSRESTNSRERNSSSWSDKKAGERSERLDRDSRTDIKKGTSHMNPSRKSGSGMNENVF